MRLIELDAALDALREVIVPAEDIGFGDELTDGYNDGINMAVTVVSVLPTVDAVPVRHGRWKGHYCEDDGIRDGWECSACGEWYYFGENKPNFCPHCGAKMDGKDGDHHD